MKTLFTTLFAFVVVLAFGQISVRPMDLVQSAREQGAVFSPVQLFQAAPGAVLSDEKAPKEYDILDISQYELEQLLQDEPEAMTLMLPASFQPGPMEVLLVKVNPFAEDFSVRTSDGRTLTDADIELGVHYRGILKGGSSIAAFSFFPHDVMGMLSTKGNGNLVVGQLKGPRQQGRYIIYQDRDVLQDIGFSCETLDDGIGYTREELEPQPGTRALSDCVGLYFEVDDDVVTDKGGAVGATNYVTGVYNQVATLYANESINTVLTQVFAWTTNSPYSSTSSSGMLSQFQGYWGSSGSWPGALGQLVSYQASGGIAAGFSGICASDRRNSQSFSSINSTYSTVPTYSWTVMVVTHEFGHTFGSRHTHACVWNGNNTAIDGCSGSTEGSCSLPGYPSQGGTLMSYCHLQSVGINFNEGFGPQPGNVIRNVIANANCLAPCGPPSCTDGIQNGNETGVDCGGPDCPACPTCSDGVQNGDETGVDCGGSFCSACPCNGNGVTLTIVLDNYPEETSWEIRDGGTVVASGGTYGSNPDGSTVIENACLPDGCYDFIIYDAYGDGICCAYGSGSYTLTDDSDGSTLASGGAFTSSQTTNFCVSTGGGGPTCTDGIQNGDETGVDCGGSSCPACPTCNDGIQNGNETDVDCGGPDCPACPTCDDGIQNGDETGVDCGGSCPPCGGGGCTPASATFSYESGLEGWSDGGSDCRRYASSSRAWDGNYSIEIRDNSGAASSTTSPAYDLSEYSSVDIEFYFYPNSMENGEDFWVRFNNGSGWNTVATYARGSSFNNGSFYVATVTIPGSSLSNNCQFRFQCDASANSDQIYIDLVTISGNCSSLPQTGGPTQTIREVETPPHYLGIEAVNDFDIADVKLYPNPAQSELNLDIPEAMNVQAVRIFSANGAEVKQAHTLNNFNTIDISALAPGVYFLSIQTEDEVINKKFIKQ